MMKGRVEDTFTAHPCPSCDRNLRSLRRGIVAHLLGELFQGPGAVNAIPWIEEHHKDDLENLGLVDWLTAIDTRAKCGIHRASSGMDYSMGELLQYVGETAYEVWRTRTWK